MKWSKKKTDRKMGNRYDTENALKMPLKYGIIFSPSFIVTYMAKLHWETFLTHEIKGN